MAEDKGKRTELFELGEFGLIEKLTENIIIRQKGTVKGVGDDAAVLDIKDKLTLVSTDLLIEGVHFDMTYTPLKHLGYKAAVVNFSDIIAMNGTPTQITVSISVSNRFSLEALEELYSGVMLACEKYNVDLVGGDTTTSLHGLYISVTALGEVSKDKVVYRSTAKKGDLICVTGDLGAAYMGLMILEREKQVFKSDPNLQPDFEGNEYILGRQLKPEARQDILKVLEGTKVTPTAMIDISDGLASDIMHICKGSELGCKLYEDKLPISQEVMKAAMQFKISSTTAALNGGEDYELLFTIAQDDYEKIKDIMGISVIGHMTEQQEGMSIIADNGEQIELKAQGWDGLKRD
jgi:thiamine-monophosphate kinase